MPATDRSPGGTPRDTVRLEPLAEVVLPAGAGAPAAARLVIAEQLTGRVSEAVLHDAALLGTELVSNSVRHAAFRETGTMTLHISFGAGIVRLETEDSGIVGTVVARPPDRESGGGGFGLDRVRILAARWGVSRAAGTRAWLELPSA